MRAYTPTTAFTTPPRNQGQMVTYSYALDADAEVIIERRHDGSDTSYMAYAYPADESPFEPWNDVPSLGDQIGPCSVVE